MSRLSCLLSSSFSAASLCFLVVVCLNLVVQVENKSFFGIGTRIIGDQLLLKDILQTPPIGFTQEPVIKFQYAIDEPITYLEIESDKNVFAKVNFSYELNLVEGIISSINRTFFRASRPEPFKVLIHIYGFNGTVYPSINPAYILNRNQQFNGILKPIYTNKIDQTMSLTEEDLKNLDLDYDDDDDVEDDDDIVDEDVGGDGDIDYEEDYFNSTNDKIIEQGQRQEGDCLVYESSQTSATTTKLPTNHSVIFYYVDIYYITYVKFIIYEHYVYKPLNSYENTYVIEYAQISPTTLKATVTDLRTTSLYVHMEMYGFLPTALPVDYKPFLTSSQTSATNRPVSSLTQLKLLMNAQQSSAKQQQEQNNSSRHLQQQQQQQQQQPLAELGHKKISPNNESNINCVQQVSSLSPSSSSSSSSSSNVGTNIQRNFTSWSTFNSIVIFFMTMMISSV